MHLGLGVKREIRSTEIPWPSGIVQCLEAVDVDQLLTVSEPEDDAEPRSPMS